jgi:hypothetical protein
VTAADDSPGDGDSRPRALARARWTGLASAHRERAEGLLAGHRARAAAGTPHPVEDFLFTYYSLRPAQLRRWHPGVRRALTGDVGDRRTWRHHREVEAIDDDGRPVRALGLDVAAYVRARGDTVRHVRALVAATASRPAQLGCFGLHEWAMVYRLPPAEVRHERWPLRLGAEGTDAVVRTHRIRCTHYDAFRFFTPQARPRNAVQPHRDDQVALEQPGCLHATMDLYKWAYKLGPAVPGDLLLDAFVLARDVRQLDMRASPYDLTSLGYSPVAVETAGGKAQYVEAQRAFAERAAVLRRALLDVCRGLTDTPGLHDPSPRPSPPDLR